MASVSAFWQRRSLVPAHLLLLTGFVVFPFMAPSFMTVANMLNILQQSSIVLLLATGMTCVMITGGIDLSVGSAAALFSLVMAAMIQAHVDPVLGGLVTLAIAAIIGAINGSLVIHLGVPPLIVTLAALGIMRGLALLVWHGRSVPVDAQWAPRSPTAFPGAQIIWIGTLLLILAAHAALRFTVRGRHLYAIGDNPSAARRFVPQYRATHVSAYAISQVLAAIAGMILVARLGAGSPLYGVMYEMDAITAAMLGGVSLSGGRGSIIGALVGAFAIATLRNGLALSNADPNLQYVLTGSLLLMAAFLANADQPGGRGR